ncbi:MAG: CPBP family glutamic-type intramembrane protease [Candidatus Neomarinimicrobiota bacterium]
MNINWADYFRLSRTAWYSLVFILPLVAVYEVLAVMINWESALQLRNGADVLLRQLLAIFGLSAPHVLAGLLACAVAGAWLWQRKVHSTSRVAGAHLAVMLVESVLWAGFLLVSLSTADQLLLTTASNSVLRTAFLAVGAGIYEEGVFRLALITPLAAFFLMAMDWRRPVAWGLAVFTAAVLFSLFHYVGPGGETFGWNSFGYRCVAGVILGLLFVYRGFGITVYAHTVYDLLVLGMLTVR